VLFELANRINSGEKSLAPQLRALGGLLGLLQRAAEAFLQGEAPVPVEEIERLIAAREDARRSKDFKAADDLRRKLLDKGIVLEDSGSKTTWRRK
jgi:cysteinyl-tRNA synthetase